MKQIKRSADPDLLFIEPCETVVTTEIRPVASMAQRDVRYEIGPFIALVDGPDFEIFWEERRGTLFNHVVGADVVAVSRADLLEPGEIESVRDKVAEKAQTDRVLELSNETGKGLKEVIAAIDGREA